MLESSYISPYRPIIWRDAFRGTEQADVERLIAQQIDPCMRVSALADSDEEDLGSARVIVFIEVLTHPVRSRPAA